RVARSWTTSARKPSMPRARPGASASRTVRRPDVPRKTKACRLARLGRSLARQSRQDPLERVLLLLQPMAELRILRPRHFAAEVGEINSQGLAQHGDVFGAQLDHHRPNLLAFLPRSRHGRKRLEVEARGPPDHRFGLGA